VAGEVCPETIFRQARQSALIGFNPKLKIVLSIFQNTELQFIIDCLFPMSNLGINQQQFT
jgi:hypothetical protein